MAVRQRWTATVECGSVGPDMARLDLGDMHLWLYPNDDGTVLVETEEKSAFEMLAGQVEAPDVEAVTGITEQEGT